jgi:hypothetical protein
MRLVERTQSLGEIGCVARAAIPDLEHAASTGGESLRKFANESLKKIRARKCD